MMRSTLCSLLALLAASACQSPGTSTPADTTATTTTDGTTSPGSTSSTGATTDLPTSDGSGASDASASGSTTTPGTTTSSSSTTGDSPTSTVTTDVTTGDGVVFPTDCETPVATPYEDALVDTFFIHEPMAGSQCVLVDDPPDAYCEDLDFGAAASYQLFHSDNGSPDPNLHMLGLFAARFGAPQPRHDDLDVPPTSWVGARVKFHMARPDAPKPWKALTLQLLRFADGDVWGQGNGLGSTCMDPAASFRCRKCDDGNKPCVLPWATGTQPFEYPMAPVAALELADDPGAQGVDVEIDLPADAVPWLVDTGVMLVPQPQVSFGAVTVTTLEGPPQLGPQLSILYCPPAP